MTNNKFPNFLIAGMAKCGTTSLSQYLQQHPDVFISEKKEPRYITSQCIPLPLGGPKDHLVESWYVKDRRQYLELFESADAQAIGEASADTLYYYDKTIPFIKEHFGEIKIIIILRNPVARAYSAYQHLVRDEREALTFEEGLLAEPERIRENYELIYYYKNAGLYFEPVQAFMRAFRSVKVIISEEMIENPQEVLSDVFTFLEVDPSFSVDFTQKYNLSGIPKNRVLHESLQNDTFLRKAVRPFARTLFPSKKARTGIINWLSGKNLVRTSIAPETSQQLKEYFAKDIDKTGKLIGRDLSGWTK